MAAGRQQQQRRVGTEEEPPLQPRRSQNLKVSLAEISDAPAVRIPPFPAHGEASIGESPCAKPASHPIEAAGAARRRRKAEGARRRKGRRRRRGDTSSAQQHNNQHLRPPTHPPTPQRLAGGRRRCRFKIFCRGSGIVSFQTKARSLAREAQQLNTSRTRTSLEEWHLKGRGARRNLATCLGAREVDRREREKTSDLWTTGSDQLQLQRQEPGGSGRERLLKHKEGRTNARSERQRSAQSLRVWLFTCFPLPSSSSPTRETEAASRPGLKE